MCDWPSDLSESAVCTSETIERSLVCAVLARTRTKMPPSPRRSGEHVVACAALDGKRLAGQGRLVDHGASLLDDASMQMDMPVRTATKSPLKLGRGNAYLGVADDLLRLVGHIEQRVDELVFAHGAGVVLEQFAHIKQEHRLPRGVDITFDERNADGRRVKHRNGQARLRELTEGGAQKGHVTGYDKHRTQGRGQKPSARIVAPMSVARSITSLCLRGSSCIT